MASPVNPSKSIVEPIKAFPAYMRGWVHPLNSEEPFPDEQKAYEAAVRVVEQAVSAPLDKVSKLNSYLKRLHAAVMSFDPDSNPGSYRFSLEHEVSPGKVDIDGDDLEDHVKKHDIKSIRFFQEVRSHLAQGEALSDIAESSIVSPKAKDFINRYFRIVPSAKNVQKEMDRFLSQVLDKRQKKKDPIETAAFAHQGVVQIHPFLDGNGRVARLFMNTILMQGGHQPLAFPDEKAYNAAVGDEKDPTHFEKLVRDLSARFDRGEDVRPKDLTQQARGSEKGLGSKREVD